MLRGLAHLRSAVTDLMDHRAALAGPAGLVVPAARAAVRLAPDRATRLTRMARTRAVASSRHRRVEASAARMAAARPAGKGRLGRGKRPPSCLRHRPATRRGRRAPRLRSDARSRVRTTCRSTRRSRLLSRADAPAPCPSHGPPRRASASPCRRCTARRIRSARWAAALARRRLRRRRAASGSGAVLVATASPRARRRTRRSIALRRRQARRTALRCSLRPWEPRDRHPLWRTPAAASRATTTCQARARP